MTTKRLFFFSFCCRPGATSHAVVLRAFHTSMYRRSLTNLNVKKTHTHMHNTAWYAAKTRFPYSLSLMSGRCSPPTRDEGLCSSILSLPLFPPSPLPPPVNQRSWLSPDGRQSTVSHESEACLSLLLFKAPCLLKFFHLMLPVASLTPLPKLPQYSFVFAPS